MMGRHRILRLINSHTSIHYETPSPVGVGFTRSPSHESLKGCRPIALSLDRFGELLESLVMFIRSGGQLAQTHEPWVVPGGHGEANRRFLAYSSSFMGFIHDWTGEQPEGALAIA